VNDSCCSALGDLAMIFDIIPTVYRSKLDVVEAGTADFDYMLAAILFDVVKKNALAHKALRGYLLHADPDLTRRVLDDVRSLEEFGQDYEALAHATEERMLEAVGEVADDHVELADLLLRWQDGGGGASPEESR
jgi:hypothetical protein